MDFVSKTKTIEKPVNAAIYMLVPTFDVAVMFMMCVLYHTRLSYPCYASARGRQ